MLDRKIPKWILFITILICTSCSYQSFTVEPVVNHTQNIPTMTIDGTEQPPPTSTPDPTAASTFAPTPTEDTWKPIFDQFIEDVKNGNANQVVGLWVENVVALRVVYQPANDPGFVSTENNVATYFMYPWEKAGNHGLLAHNYLFIYNHDYIHLYHGQIDSSSQNWSHRIILE